jgi:hypothetical protein
VKGTESESILAATASSYVYTDRNVLADWLDEYLDEDVKLAALCHGSLLDVVCPGAGRQ